MHFPLATRGQPDFLKILKIMICYKYKKYFLVVVTKQDTKNFYAKYRPISTKWGKIRGFFKIFFWHISKFLIIYTTWQGLCKNV